MYSFKSRWPFIFDSNSKIFWRIFIKLKKLIIGILISIIFIYFSFHGVSFEKILKVFQNLRYIFLIPSIILLLSITILRSLRLGVMLSTMEKIHQRTLLPITCVGFMGIALVPMRIGELIRPYLVSKESQISFSSALATIFVERMIDSLTIILILFLIIFTSPLPEWIVRTGYGFLAVFVFFLFFVCFLYFNTKFSLQLLRSLTKILPLKLVAKVEGMISSFTEGLKIIGSPVRLGYTILLSFVIWGISGLVIYSFFFLLNLQLSLLNAFIVLIITIIGISLPAGPGFIGNFQFACIIALSIFGVPKDIALAFSMVYYFIGIGIQILLGLIFLPFLKLSFEDLNKIKIFTRPS